MLLRTFAAALLVAAFAAVPASAHEVTLGSLTITDLWTRATPPNAPTAGGYMTITNNGGEDDTLVSAASPVAESAELHTMTVKDGVMTMHPVEGGIAVPAGQKVTLGPGGYHIMFITLSGAPKEGGKFPVTLTFAKAGTVDTFLHVLAVGAAGPTPGGAGQMNHDMSHGDMSGMAPSGNAESK